MLPDPDDRRSSSTRKSGSGHKRGSDDKDGKRQPSSPPKLPTSDFSSHFVVKGDSTEHIPPPTVTISQCPVDAPAPTPPQRNNKSDHKLLVPPPQTHSLRSESRPVTSPLMMVPPPSHPYFTRRSTSLQHPFMKSPPKNVVPSSPSSGRTSSSAATTSRSNLLSFPDSPMDFSYQPVTPYCLRKNKMGEFEPDKPEESLISSNGGGGSGDETYETILKICGQKRPIPIDMIFNGIKDIVKVGEGVYGEVYSAKFRYFSQCSWVYKVVAIAGDAIVNGEKQKEFSEVLPEVLVSQELSKLKGVLNKCYTDGYAFMKNARIAKGKYPTTLVQAWEKFNNKYESDNDKPNKFRPDQLYMILEFEFAGQDVESLNFRDALQTLSVVVQVAHILAAGECALEFEHRDLHWGNILVQNWQASTVRYLINGETFHVPSIGIKAAVIDFTLSRVKHSKTNAIAYLDLQDDEEQFLGTGDHQFDIYRMMRDHNRNNWETFSPKTNIYWLHYLANKLYVKGQYTSSATAADLKKPNHIRAVRKLREFSHLIMGYDSAKDFVMSKESLEYRVFLGLPISPTNS